MGVAGPNKLSVLSTFSLEGSNKYAEHTHVLGHCTVQSAASLLFFSHAEEVCDVRLNISPSRETTQVVASISSFRSGTRMQIGAGE